MKNNLNKITIFSISILLTCLSASTLSAYSNINQVDSKSNYLLVNNEMGGAALELTASTYPNIITLTQDQYNGNGPISVPINDYLFIPMTYNIPPATPTSFTINSDNQSVLVGGKTYDPYLINTYDPPTVNQNSITENCLFLPKSMGTSKITCTLSAGSQQLVKEWTINVVSPVW